MIINLNDGTQIDIPRLSYSDPLEYKWQYQENSGMAVFNILETFCDKVDDLGGGFTRPSEVYNIVNDLRYKHDEDYYSTGAGKSEIDLILANSIWVLGDEDNGGLLMTKVGSKYTFISYSGVYQGQTGTSEAGMWRYGFGSPAVELYGEWIGCWSRQELRLATLYHDHNDTSRLWLMWQPDGEAIKYWFDTIDSSTSLVANLPTAMSDSRYFTNALLRRVPRNSWIVCMPDGTAAINNNYLVVAEEFTFTDYDHIGGSIYDESYVDETHNPYAYSGNVKDTGDGGKYSDYSDPIDKTDLDQFDTDGINSGFYTLYNPTKSEVIAFNNFLFTDITDALSTQLKKLVTNPLDYVLFIAMCHFSPVSSGSYSINFCGIDSGVSAPVIDNQHFQVDCDWVYLDEEDECGGFLSFNPYYQIQCYLPYIGIVDLNPDDVMGANINICYTIDLMTGSCIAQIVSNRSPRSYLLKDPHLNSVIGEYSGNCYLNMPLSATDWRGLYQSMVQFAGGMISAAGGNAGGVASAAQAVMSEKVTVSKSGKLGANYGYMGHQIPYLILSRPNPAMPDGFGKREGYPTYKYQRLGDCNGYTEIDPDTLWCEFKGIYAEEIAMIKTLLNQGVKINKREE